MLSIMPPTSSICESITSIRQVNKDCIIYTYYKDCSRAIQEHFDKSITLFQNKSMAKDFGLPMCDRNLPQSFWNASTTTITDMSNSVASSSHHPHHAAHQPSTSHHPSMHPNASHHPNPFTSSQSMVNAGTFPPIFTASSASAAAGSAATATGHHDLYPPEAYHHTHPHASSLHHPMHHQPDSWAYSYHHHHRAAVAATATASAMHDHLTNNRLNAAQYSSLLLPTSINTSGMRSRFTQVTGPCSSFDKSQMAAAAAADMHWSTGGRYDFSSHAHSIDANYAAAYGGAVSTAISTGFHQPVN